MDSFPKGKESGGKRKCVCVQRGGGGGGGGQTETWRPTPPPPPLPTSPPLISIELIGSKPGCPGRDTGRDLKGLGARRRTCPKINAGGAITQMTPAATQNQFVPSLHHGGQRQNLQTASATPDAEPSRI